MSLTTIIVGVAFATGQVSLFNKTTNSCPEYIERTAPQIIAEYKLGERNFDCTKIPKVRGRRVSPMSPERNFADEDLSKASFKGSQLQDTGWDWVDVSGADFSYANLSRADIAADVSLVQEGTELERTNFTGTKLRCATLSGSFAYADFTSADLRCWVHGQYTSISEGNFSHGVFYAARFSASSNFPEAENLTCSQFSKEDISRLLQHDLDYFICAQAPNVREGQRLCESTETVAEE